MSHWRRITCRSCLDVAGHKVAVIGSGPAGITAAYSLALLGHEVEVFDDKPKPGGYLRTGIPDYRLPKKILDEEIALVEQAGVKFNQSIRVGRDLTLQDVRSRFDSVIVAVGLHASRNLGVPGSNHPQVYDGVELLEKILLGKIPDFRGRSRSSGAVTRRSMLHARSCAWV